MFVFIFLVMLHPPVTLKTQGYWDTIHAWPVDYDSMCATLEDINWADIMNSMNTLDAWSYFKAIFKRQLTRLYLWVDRTIRKVFIMSAEAFQLWRLKRKLWKRYCLSKADCDYSTFKDASNRLRSLRCQHEANLVSNTYSKQS